MGEQNNTQEEQKFFTDLQNRNEFQITSCELKSFDNKDYSKLQMSSEQKMQVSEFLQHVPSAITAGELAGAYTVRFPKGLPHTLMSLKQGGFGSSIIGESGKIAGSASFYPMIGQAAVLGVFTAMSIATGQFFLTQINKELHLINQKLSDILEWLYTEKKAELIAEVEFVRYAVDNYASIMTHDLQRAATITSLQESKKVAVKDIEFYMEDLNKKADSGLKMKFNDLSNLINAAFIPTKKNLEFSLQLYFLSSLMEIYYSQNFDKNYIQNLEKSIKGYFDMYDKRINQYYGQLKNDLQICYVSASNKTRWDKDMIQLEKLISSQKHNELLDKLRSVLSTTAQGTEYYIIKDGTVYCKNKIQVN